jgi:hypothetical protein
LRCPSGAHFFLPDSGGFHHHPQRGYGESFDLFDNSKLRQKMLSDLRAKEIVVTKLYKWLVEDLQKSKFTVSAARATEDFLPSWTGNG